METFIIEMFIAFLTSFFLGNWLIVYFKNSGIVGKDIHKEGEPVVATSGGIAVFLGFYFSTMGYLFLRTYYFKDLTSALNTIAGVLSILFVTIVGFLDDVNAAGGKRIGLKQWQKPLLSLPAALPLMALRLGNPTMALPIFGIINFGVIYPLLFVPLGIVGASNMVNLLAGLNGLESGMAITYLTSLSIYTYFNSTLAAKIISFGALGAVIGFFLLNKYPAKFLPGDSLTYFLGATLATIAIVGNIEKFVIVISTPFFIEFLLKLRGKLKKPTVGYLKDGKIYRREKTIYSLPHLFMNGKYTEKQIAKRMWIISAIFSLLAWFI